MATSKAQHSQTHLFLLRIWIEDLSDGKTEWRGQVKHVLSGEVRYFRDWATLADHLQAMSHSLEQISGEPDQGA